MFLSKPLARKSGSDECPDSKRARLDSHMIDVIRGNAEALQLVANLLRENELTRSIANQIDSQGFIGELSPAQRAMRQSWGSGVWQLLFSFLDLIDKARLGGVNTDFVAMHLGEDWRKAWRMDATGNKTLTPLRQHHRQRDVKKAERFMESGMYTAFDWIGFDRFDRANSTSFKISVHTTDISKSMKRYFSSKPVTLHHLHWKLESYQVDVDWQDVCRVCPYVIGKQWIVSVGDDRPSTCGHSWQEHLDLLSDVDWEFEVTFDGSTSTNCRYIDDLDKVRTVIIEQDAVSDDLEDFAIGTMSNWIKRLRNVRVVKLVGFHPSEYYEFNPVNEILEWFNTDNPVESLLLAICETKPAKSTQYHYARFHLAQGALSRFPLLTHITADYATLGHYGVHQLIANCPLLRNLNIGSLDRTTNFDFKVPDEPLQSDHFDSITWNMPISRLCHIEPFLPLVRIAKSITATIENADFIGDQFPSVYESVYGSIRSGLVGTINPINPINPGEAPRIQRLAIHTADIVTYRMIHHELGIPLGRNQMYTCRGERCENDCPSCCAHERDTASRDSKMLAGYTYWAQSSVDHRLGAGSVCLRIDCLKTPKTVWPLSQLC